MSTELDLTGIDWVRLTFVDVFGTSHSMSIPAAGFLSAVEAGVPFDGSSLEGRARLAERDMRLLPDPDTLVRLEPGLAGVACIVLDNDGTPWPGDPRTALVAVIEQTGELGSAYTAAPEFEFYLLDADGSPVDTGGYFEDTAGIGAAVVREAVDRLAEYGIAVDSTHHEAGPGQYEIDLAPLTALPLADALVLTKYVVRDAAAQAGLRATFMPRPFAREAGSGLHIHQRIASGLVEPGGELTDVGRHFLGGQLAHARAISALAAPTVNSYKRLHSGPEAPSAIVWAFVNRGALIRLSPNVTGGPTIEYRGADPSANPYLLFAGLIVAGAHGVGESTEPPAAFEEEIGSFDPAAIDSARSELLPRDLDEALDSLGMDDAVADAFEPQLLQLLIDGRRSEAAAYAEQVTPWEVDRYLEEA
jgi:glutamine synthetase